MYTYVDASKTKGAGGGDSGLEDPSCCSKGLLQDRLVELVRQNPLRHGILSASAHPPPLFRFATSVYNGELAKQSWPAPDKIPEPNCFLSVTDSPPLRCQKIFRPIENRSKTETKGSKIHIDAS